MGKAVVVKGKSKPKGDGRADPGPFDFSKHDACAANVGAPKINKKLVKHVTSTPVTHQSGKGVRGVRENIYGTPKTAIIRYAGSKGIELARVVRFVLAAGCYMTTAVAAKHWREGATGTVDINVTDEAVAALKNFK